MKSGFLSDAHGNFRGFLKGFQILKHLGTDQIFFLGDSIGYFDSLEVAYFLDQAKIPCVMGNHEWMVTHREIQGDKESLYRLVQHFGNQKLRGFISKWQERITFEVDGLSIEVFHGSYDDPIFGYTSSIDSLTSFQGADLVVCGATHRPFVRYEGENLKGRILANCGSCGFPRDHGQLGSIGIVDTNRRFFEIIRYDISGSINFLLNTHNNLDDLVMKVFQRCPMDNQIVGKLWN